MATAEDSKPQRRLEDHHPEAKIDWSKPGAPAVPLSNTAGAANGGITSLEAAAKAIYERFVGADEHPWVESGNSNMQDKARDYARAALATQAQAAAPATDLHNAIMNLPCKRADHEFMNAEHRMLYKNGHRDARHAAAELALAHPAAAVEPKAWESEMHKGADAKRVMMSAFAHAPSELSHPDKMAWIGDFFLKHYDAVPPFFAAVEPVAIPAGFVLVPVEPTEAMRAAYICHSQLDDSGRLCPVGYKAAIAAAPIPAAEDAAKGELPAILFDGKAVHDEIVRVHGTSIPEAVSQTLDAVVRLMRKEPGAAPSEQLAAPEQPDVVFVLQQCADALAYAAYNYDGSNLEDLKPGIVESTGVSDTALIAERNAREAIRVLKSVAAPTEAQGAAREVKGGKDE